MLYLTLRQLEYVVTVARAGSMTAAANILNVSQPSLSVALTHVERQLRQRLFIRRKGVPMTTTSFGERYVAEAEALLSLAKRLEDPEATRRQLNGSLTLGCSEDLAPRYLAPMLKHLRALVPNVELRWKESDFGTLARDMIEGRVDIALTYDLGLDATFERTVLGSIAPHALVAETDDLRSRESVWLHELAERSLILFEEGLSNRHVLGLFRQIGATPSVMHRVKSLELMRSLAANAEGVGISYTVPTNDLCYDGSSVVAVRIADPNACEPLILARTSIIPPSEIVVAARRCISRIFAEQMD